MEATAGITPEAEPDSGCVAEAGCTAVACAVADAGGAAAACFTAVSLVALVVAVLQPAAASAATIINARIRFIGFPQSCREFRS
jgi:hypothetical protein